MELVKWFDAQPLWLRIILLILTGGISSGIYRILRYTASKDETTLIAGILCFVFFGLVLMIVDVVTLCSEDKISVLCK